MTDYTLVGETTHTTSEEPSPAESVRSDGDVTLDSFAQTTSESLRRVLDAHPITFIYAVSVLILAVILLVSLANVALFGVLHVALLVASAGAYLIVELGTKLVIILIETTLVLTCLAGIVATFFAVGPFILQASRRGLSRMPELLSQADRASLSNALAAHFANLRERHAALTSAIIRSSTSVRAAEDLCFKTMRWIRAFPLGKWLAAMILEVAVNLTEKSIYFSKSALMFMRSFYSQCRPAQADSIRESAEPPRDVDGHNPLDTSGKSTSVSVSLNNQVVEQLRAIPTASESG
ncbi:hypothetical protein LshimejAT787_0702740 [Lyophyllum shimeji]|uniref:Transmembrane protein n=1 Tax=Lyophyllum shimeji TaxID=47721 RepID=A0A9P3PQL9_LYOSH|nr:hypothetical protein LshimejAT787_0702740 [Lyophyllum shimeji]